MDATPAIFSLVLMSLMLAPSSATDKSEHVESHCQGLVSYKLELEGRWSDKVFPKQYPYHRPPAQWSKLIGRTHNKDYVLWSEGQVSRNEVRQFVENSQSNYLDSEPQGNLGIFDAFHAPSILSGTGKSAVKFLAYQHHTKLSFLVRMIPSPDWFIGASGLDLCSDGHWLESKQFDLDPMDAGSDRGLTFTAPNWAELKPKPISKITCKFPNHSASSFYYPELETLPPIAVLKLTKVSLPWNDTSDFDIKNMPTSYETIHKPVFREYIPEPMCEEARPPMISPIQSNPIQPEPVVMSVQSMPLQNDVQRKPSGASSPPTIRTRSSKLRKTVLKSADGKTDCEVSNWSSWTSCSKTCGYGQQVRTRSVVRRSRNGGRGCPALREDQVCGSMRGCGWQHFSSNNWGKNSSAPASTGPSRAATGGAGAGAGARLENKVPPVPQ